MLKRVTRANMGTYGRAYLGLVVKINNGKVVDVYPNMRVARMAQVTR